MTWMIWRYPYDFGNHHMFLLCFYYYICFYSFQIFREGPSVKDHKIGYQKPKSSAQKWSLFIFNRAENLDVYRTIAVLSIFSDSISGGFRCGHWLWKTWRFMDPTFSSGSCEKKTPSRISSWDMAGRRCLTSKTRGVPWSDCGPLTIWGLSNCLG